MLKLLNSIKLFFYCKKRFFTHCRITIESEVGDRLEWRRILKVIQVLREQVQLGEFRKKLKHVPQPETTIIIVSLFMNTYLLNG